MMQDATMIDIFGYLSSAMIALSLMMKDIVWLRILNFIGCSMFALYGFLVEAYPITIANIFVGLVNLYHLWKLKQTPNTVLSTLTDKT